MLAHRNLHRKFNIVLSKKETILFSSSPTGLPDAPPSFLTPATAHRHSEMRRLYPFPNPSISDTPIQSEFSDTTDLTISSHSLELCKYLPPIIMPDPDTLRITHYSYQTHLEVCRCSHSKCAAPLCTEDPPCEGCPLLATVDPRRVIFGGVMSGIAGVGSGLLLAGVPFPGPNVKEVVIYAGLQTGREKEPDYSALRSLPATVEKLTIILGVIEFNDVMRWADGSDASLLVGDDYSVYPTGKARTSSVQQALVQAGVSGAQLVEIVGLEAIRYPSEGSSRTWLKDCKTKMGKMLVKELVDKGWSKKAAAGRVKDIVYKKWKGKAPMPSRIWY